MIQFFENSLVKRNYPKLIILLPRLSEENQTIERVGRLNYLRCPLSDLFALRQLITSEGNLQVCLSLDKVI